MGKQPACPYSTGIMQLLFGLQTSDTVQVNTKGFFFFHRNRNAVVKIPGAQVGSLSEAAYPFCLTIDAQKIAILAHFLQN